MTQMPSEPLSNWTERPTKSVPVTLAADKELSSSLSSFIVASPRGVKGESGGLGGAGAVNITFPEYPSSENRREEKEE